jgi:hypothetical protein
MREHGAMMARRRNLKPVTFCISLRQKKVVRERQLPGRGKLRTRDLHTRRGWTHEIITYRERIVEKKCFLEKAWLRAVLKSW